MQWLYYAGVSIDSIRKSICEFTAVEHRIEYVTEKNGVTYYNDSKGTNPDAAIKGIQAMNRPTLLIGGGYDKGSSYDEWLNAFDGKVPLSGTDRTDQGQDQRGCRTSGCMPMYPLRESGRSSKDLCSRKQNQEMQYFFHLPVQAGDSSTIMSSVEICSKNT